MRNEILIIGLILLIPIAFAESPPAIPMEVWGEATLDGSPVGDGLNVEAKVDGVDYAQATVTQDGFYDVILVNGDRPLTYNDDSNCAVHWGAGEACVPCIPGYGPDHPGNELDYCIEGPQDGQGINIVIDSKPTIPVTVWNEGEIVRHDLVVIDGGVIDFSINLVSGWNLISIPVLPIDSSITSIMGGCDYNRIWEFQSDQTWKTSDIDLSSMNNYNGYWIDRVGITGDCEITISGTVPTSTTIDINTPWTLVGYPSVTPNLISNIVSPGSYNRIWEFQSDQTWKTSDIDLNTMSPGQGYWIDSSTTGSYIVNG